MDRLIIEFDRALRAVLAPARSVGVVPGEELRDTPLPETDRRHAAALMRVNHCGEICAQALYQGQAWTARDPAITAALRQAAEEEAEHLAWTEKRIGELGGRPSWLNPLWYAGALGMGLAAGRLGDGWNLGFLAETEKQVESHLKGHLERLPQADGRSRAIVDRMAADELRHGQTAEALGARPLPLPMKLAMGAAARVMTSVAYWV